MGMLPFLLKEIAPIRIFGQELFTFVFLYRLFITYPLKPSGIGCLASRDLLRCTGTNQLPPAFPPSGPKSIT